MSFPRYPAYKPSGVEWLGVVPEHWSIKQLKHCIHRLGSGGTPESGNPDYWADDESDDSIPWVAIGDMSSASVVYSTAKSLTQAGITEKNLEIFPAGSLLYSIYASLGKVSILGVDAAFNQAILAIVSNSDLVSQPFLKYWLENIEKHLSYYSSSNTQANLNAAKVLAYPVAVPHPDEQARIATFLDRETAKIDALITEQQRLIELLQEKRQAVISHAVTKGLNPNAPMKDSGVEWLGEVPEHWSVCAVGHRYEVRLGKMLDEKRITGQSPGPYLRNTDVQWDSINTDELPEMDFEPSEYERYSLKEGDLLVCEGGEVGRCAIWEAELPICFYQKALHRLRPLDSSLDNPRFQLYIMRMACSKGVFEASSGKATINHLPAETFRRYRFAYPPAHEQHSISEHLLEACGDLNALQRETQSLVGKLQERRSALISAAVTGQIDVRGLVEAEAGDR